MFKHNKQ